MEMLVVLTAQLAAPTARVATFQERSELRFDGIERAIERLVAAQERIDASLARTLDDVLELRYARRAPAYLSRVARRLRVLETGALAGLLDEAPGGGRLSDDEWDTVLLA